MKKLLNNPPWSALILLITLIFGSYVSEAQSLKKANLQSSNRSDGESPAAISGRNGAGVNSPMTGDVLRFGIASSEGTNICIGGSTMLTPKGQVVAGGNATQQYSTFMFPQRVNSRVQNHYRKDVLMAAGIDVTKPITALRFFYRNRNTQPVTFTNLSLKTALVTGTAGTSTLFHEPVTTQLTIPSVKFPVGDTSIVYVLSTPITFTNEDYLVTDFCVTGISTPSEGLEITTLMFVTDLGAASHINSANPGLGCNNASKNGASGGLPVMEIFQGEPVNYSWSAVGGTLSNNSGLRTKFSVTVGSGVQVTLTTTGITSGISRDTTLVFSQNTITAPSFQSSLGEDLCLGGTTELSFPNSEIRAATGTTSYQANLAFPANANTRVQFVIPRAAWINNGFDDTKPLTAIRLKVNNTSDLPTTYTGVTVRIGSGSFGFLMPPILSVAPGEEIFASFPLLEIPPGESFVDITLTKPYFLPGFGTTPNISFCYISRLGSNVLVEGFTANGSGSGPITGCNGTFISSTTNISPVLYLTQGDRMSYSWSATGGTLSSTTGTKVNFTPTSNGSASVTLTATNLVKGCSGTTIKNFAVVSDIGTVSLSQNTAICVGEPAQITFNGVNATRFKIYTTSSGTDTIAISSLVGQHPVVNYYVAGVAGACEGPRTEFSVNTKVSQSTDITHPSAASPVLCGNNITLVSAFSGTHTWYRNNVPLAETSNQLVVSIAGSYTAKANVGSNGCPAIVGNTIVVTEGTAPSTPTITAAGPTTFCSGGSVTLQGPAIGGGETYLWSNGATTQDITVTSSGNYSLQVVAGSCTSAVSNAIAVTVQTCGGAFTWNGIGPWTTAANWTPAIVPPVGSDIIVQSGTLTVNGNYAINNLTVNGGSNLFIGGGSVLNIAGNAIVNGGSNANGGGEINLNGTGNQLLSSAGAGAWNIGTLRVSNNSGTVTLNRQLLIWRELILGNGSIFDLNGRSLTLKANATSRVTANLNMIAGNAQLLNTSGFWCEVAYPKSPAGSGGSWVQTAPPVQGQQVRSLHQKGNFPSIESYNAAIPASGSFYWFSNSFTTHPTNNGFYKPSDSTEAWPLGKGIRAWIRKVPADNGAFGYKGAPFTGNSFVINSLDYCTNNCAIVDPNGLNLVGNPLAATINWDLLTRNHVEDAMYQYNHSQLIYATYIDGVGVNGGRKEIATGQGFFVHALQAGASITVPQTAVVPASTFAIFRSGTIEDLLRININLGDSSVDEMAIRLKDGATHNFDSRYDGRKMTGSGINIASIAEDGRRLSVDARPLTTGMIRIPLVMSRMNNLRNEELVFTGIESFGTKKVYLNHPSFDAPVQLTEGQRFTISPAYATGLEVIINNSPEAIEGQLSNTFSLYPNPATENLTVSGINSGTVVSVLTVQGKEIIRQTLGAEGSLSVKALPQGLYFVEINGIKKTFVKQ